MLYLTCSNNPKMFYNLEEAFSCILVIIKIFFVNKALKAIAQS